MSKPRRTITAYNGYQRRIKTTLENATDIVPWELSPAADAGYFEAERRRPARAANIESDVLVPVMQSATVGLAATLIAAYLIWYFEGAWHFACFVGLLAATVCFLGAMSLNRHLLWVVERVTNQDFDGDGYVGAPNVRTLGPVEVVHKTERGSLRTMFRLDLDDVSDADLVSFARGIVAGKSLSESTWIGKGNLFSKAQYGRLMAELERANLVAWVSPEAKSQGRRLTAQGEAALKQWANFG